MYAIGSSSSSAGAAALTMELESIESIPKTYQPISKQSITRNYTESDNTNTRERWNKNISSVPMTPAELENSRPQSPFGAELNTDVVVMKQSIRNPRRNMARLLGSCMSQIAQGLFDSAPGALLPYIQKYYGIGYSTASFIFLSNAAGFILAAFFSQALYGRVGRAWTIVCGCTLAAAGALIMGLGLPFGTIVMSFFLCGAGMAVVLAQTNVFASSLAESTVALGYVHGAYGAGGTAGPIIATAIASKGIKWSYFYFILLGFSVFNSFYSGYIFRGSERDAQVQATAQARTSPEPSRITILKKSILNKPTLLACLFIFAYQGAEVTTSGWVVSFLITTRKGDPAAVGYVTAGFWGGITAGRFLLSHLCRRYGEKRAVYFLVGGSIVFQALGWKVPNIISDAIFVSIVGVFLGPIYPCTMTVATRLIPPSLHVSSLSFVSAFGSSGGALAPFTTGVLASKFGAWVLYPVCIALFGAMEVVWWALPNADKREE